MKRAFLLSVLLVLFVVAGTQAAAMGVAPSRDVRNYAPGDMQVQLSIINTNHYTNANAFNIADTSIIPYTGRQWLPFWDCI